MAVGKLNTFVDRLLEHVPEDKKAAVRAEYSAAQDEMTTLEQARTRVEEVAGKQREWWEGNKDAVAERDRLRTELAAKGAAPVNGAITKEDLDQRDARVRADTLETGLGLVTAMTNIAMGHLHEFNEVLDTHKLTQEAIKANKALDVYYAETVATRRAERNTAQRATEIAAAREEGKKEGVTETLARGGRDLPFPVGSTAPTTLSGLRKPADGQASQYGLEAAVATANAVIAQQQGGS